jgi:hypothetical protein
MKEKNLLLNKIVFLLAAITSLTTNIYCQDYCDQETLKSLEGHILLRKDFFGAPAINKLVQIARNLLYKLNNTFEYDNKPKIIVYGLGQSAAYLIEAMKQIPYSGKKNITFGPLIAFSGGWIGKRTEKPPTENEISTYTKYLEKLIYQDDDSIIVILDYAITGDGLNSFMQVLSKSNLRDVTILYLSEKRKSINYYPSILNINIPIYGPDEGFMHQLASSDKFNDRLVAYYPNKDWGKINPNDFIPSKNALCLRQLVKQEVEKIYQKPPSNF